MPTVRLADLIGTKDGVNRNFATPTPYAAGSIAIRWKTSNLAPADVTQTDPASGLVRVADAPLVDDVFLCAYDDPPTVEPGSVVGPVTAFVEQVAALSARGGNDLVFRAGQSGKLLAFTVFDATGSTFDLTGCVLFFEARAGSENGAVVWDKTSLDTIPTTIVFENQLTDEGRGRFDVVFAAEETQAASASVTVFDLWCKTVDGDFVALLQDGRIEVRAAIRTDFPT